jgi:hypothetical protein
VIGILDKDIADKDKAKVRGLGLPKLACIAKFKEMLANKNRQRS